jgi:HPt (histidine-containing phosphotransfer) domain-containing protein
LSGGEGRNERKGALTNAAYGCVFLNSQGGGAVAGPQTSNDPNLISADMVEVFRTSATEQIATLERIVCEISAAPEQWEARKAEAHDIAHNLKGQGASFGYPLITSVAQSLLTLLRGQEKSGLRTIKIAAAHARALRTILDKDIHGGGGPRGETLVMRLSALTAP